MLVGRIWRLISASPPRREESRTQEHRQKHRHQCNTHRHLLTPTSMGSGVATLMYLSMHTMLHATHTPAPRTELSQLGQAPLRSQDVLFEHPKHPCSENRAEFPLQAESSPLWKHSLPVHGLQERTLCPTAGQKCPKSYKTPKETSLQVLPCLSTVIQPCPSLNKLGSITHHPAPSCSAQHLLPATLTAAWGQPALWPLRQDQGSLLVPWRALGECTGQPLLLSTGQVPHGASHSPALSLCPLDRKALGRNEASAEGSTATFCGGGAQCPTACEVRGGGRCGDNMSMVSV